MRGRSFLPLFGSIASTAFQLDPKVTTVQGDETKLSDVMHTLLANGVFTNRTGSTIVPCRV